MLFTKQDELLREKDSEEPYRRRKDEEKKSISWGQRKLLLTLVSFLSNHLESFTNRYVILYTGAAPGVNIGIVAQLFPNVTFHCYDPSSFKIKTDLKKRIIVYQKKFTDELAHYWSKIQEKDRNIYLVSDIRTADYTKTESLAENEKQIMSDMELQKRWVEIIKPCKAHLKFRLPYTIPNLPLEIEYFDGILYKQPYAPSTSTETRLVVDLTDGLKYKKYSCEKYQSQMFYHNIVIREKWTYDNEYMDEPEILNDFDSCCEISIWKDYLRFSSVSDENINKESVIALTRKATKLLTKGRKYSDTLSYLRENPQAIKKRNFN